MIGAARTQSSRIAHRAVDLKFSISYVLQKSGANVSYGIDSGGGRCGHIAATLNGIRPHGLGTPASTLTWGAVRRVMFIAPTSLLPASVVCNGSHTGGDNTAGSVVAPLSNTTNSMKFSAAVVCVATAGTFPADGQLHSRLTETGCRRVAGAALPPSARSVLCRGPLPSPLDARQNRPGPRSGAPSGTTEGGLGETCTIGLGKIFLG
jgi:hypothetical protein